MFRYIIKDFLYKDHNINYYMITDRLLKKNVFMSEAQFDEIKFELLVEINH